MAKDEIKDIVRDKYGQAALRVVTEGATSCCGTSSSCGAADPITSNLYSTAETSDLPAQAVGRL